MVVLRVSTFLLKVRLFKGTPGIVNNGDGTFWILTDNGLGNKVEFWR